MFAGLPSCATLGYIRAMPKQSGRLTKRVDEPGRDLMAATDRVNAGRKPKALKHELGGEWVPFLDHNPPLVLQIGLSTDGRLVCTGLLIGWQLGDSEPVEIKARDVHAIKLGALLNGLPLPGFVAASAPTFRAPHPGRAGHFDDHYRMVADLYRSARISSPASPMQRLAADLRVGMATAYRWRDEAARRGFLEPRQQTRRGPSRRTTRSGRKGQQ